MATNSSTLPGFTAAETVVMAAAYYHCKSPPDIDYEKVAEMLGSKSGASIRERLRLARKKGEQLSGSGANTSTPAPTTPKGRKTAPASGVDKKSATKVNNTPRKAKSPKIEIKAEEVEEEQDDGI